MARAAKTPATLTRLQEEQPRVRLADPPERLEVAGAALSSVEALSAEAVLDRPRVGAILPVKRRKEVGALSQLKVEGAFSRPKEEGLRSRHRGVLLVVVVSSRRRAALPAVVSSRHKVEQSAEVRLQHLAVGRPKAEQLKAAFRLARRKVMPVQELSRKAVPAARHKVAPAVKRKAMPVLSSLRLVSTGSNHRAVQVAES